MMVSVIIPNYNHAQYLNQRIDSVLNQTYQDFEVILLDDCSTDDSRDVIETYRNQPKVSHIVYNKVNSGSTFKQWEKGVSLAKGDYIWIAESDDWADLSFLEEIMSSIQKNDSVLSFCRSFIVDSFGKTKWEQPNTINKEAYKVSDFLTEYLLYGNAIYNASMVVFRKDAIKNSVWSELSDYKYCGDWLFWARLIMNQDRPVSEVKLTLNYFRTHNKNVSNKSEINGLTFFEGFPLSKKLADEIDFKDDKVFYKQWFDKWQLYRIRYSFSKTMSLRIMFFLGKYEPLIFKYEIERLTNRLFNKN